MRIACRGYIVFIYMWSGYAAENEAGQYSQLKAFSEWSLKSAANTTVLWWSFAILLTSALNPALENNLSLTSAAVIRQTQGQVTPKCGCTKGWKSMGVNFKGDNPDQIFFFPFQQDV